ncbi:MAG TPA: site-2 protease family protein, partial [Planctomycetota bacterium]|nr:site-2 protease family protein [Planctomycetota bacterium]
AALALEDAYWTPLLTSVAYVTFVLNLFNLIPFYPLDGGRITRPLRAAHWLWGLLATGVLFLVAELPGGRATVHLSVIGVLGAVQAVSAWKRERAAATAAPRRAIDILAPEAGDRARYADEAEVEPAHRRAAAIAYFGLVGVLAALIGFTAGRLPAGPG